MQRINLNRKVYDLCSDYKFLKPILINLGFKKLSNPILFTTVAKTITLEKALELQNISLDKLNEKLQPLDYVAITATPIDVDRISFLKEAFKELVKTNDANKVKSDVIAKLHYVEAYEIGIAMNQLMNEGFTVDESQRTFYLRTIVLDGVLKNDENMLNNPSKELLEFIKMGNNHIKSILDSFNKCITNKQRNEAISKLYFDLTKHYVFKENHLLKALKHHGQVEPFKVMSVVDKTIIDLIKKTMLIEVNEDIQTTALLVKSMDEITYKVNDMIFKEENVLIYLVSTFVRVRSINRIVNKIKNKMNKK